MAQKVNIVLVDDIDGTDAVETVSFALDGRDYEIDLSKRNADRLREAFAPYVGHARRGGSRRGRNRTGGPSPSDIRAWARENGFNVPDRGRVSANVREAYLAAH